MAKNRQGYSGFQNRPPENRGQEPQWVLKEVGEPVFGVRRKDWVDEKGSGRSRPFSQESDKQRLEANTLYSQALSRKMALERGRLDERFFEVLGEPSSIELSSTGDEVVLVYPFGQSKVSFSSIDASNHWERELISQPAFRIKANSIVYDVCFKGLPREVKVEKIIATFWERERPKIIEENFSLMSSSDQAEILEVLHKKLLDPEVAVNKEFSDFVSEYYFEKDLATNKQKLIDLMSPGKTRKHSQSRKETVSYGESSDGMRGPGSYETVVVGYFLAVGFKRDFLTGPICRRLFAISEADYQKEPEEIRQELIAEVKKKIETDFLNKEKDLAKDPDTRISRLEPGVWQKKYEEAWRKKQTEFLQNFYQEIQSVIEPLKGEWQKFERAQTEAAALNTSFEEAQKRARVNRVDCLDLYRSFDFPREDDEPSVFITKTVEYREIVNQVNNRVNDEIKKRGQVEIARGLEKEQAEAALREAMETGIKPARWFVFDPMDDGGSYLIQKMEEATGRKKGQ